MSSTNEKSRPPQWLFGEAEVDDGRLLPFMACASKSTLREADPAPDEHREAAPGTTAASRSRNPCAARRAGLSLIINDDHGMTPSVTIVNQTDEPVTLHAVRPSMLATENGTYDLDAVLVGVHPIIEPGAPLVFRMSDIGRNANEPFRTPLISR